MTSKKKTVESRPFPVRTPLDLLEEWRDAAENDCNYSMNQFGVMAIQGILEMIERPDGHVPHIVQVAKLGRKMRERKK